MNATPQQNIIINSTAIEPADKAKFSRIIAAAGSGKTTTLKFVSDALVNSGHKVIYVAFNKAACKEATRRFSQKIKCKTINSLALSRSNFPIGFDIKEDFMLEEEIKTKYKQDISNFISGSKGKNLFGLCGHWIFKTLYAWFAKKSDSEFFKYSRNTYYPATLNHMEKFGIEHGTFYVSMAKLCWDAIWRGELPVTHCAYQKYAQLHGFQLPDISTILIDESQDLSECQIDMLITNQLKSNKNIIICGDEAQCIYGFRGARPQYFSQIQDPDQVFGLTQSFRFGSNIASVANSILWIKENSPQGQFFRSYRVEGVSSDPGTLIYDEEPPKPFTLVSRTNSRLILKAVSFLEKDPTLSISLQGGHQKKFTKIINQVKDVYRLYMKQRPLTYFKEFMSFREFKTYVTDHEKTDYQVLIELAEAFDHSFLEKMALFEKNVIHKTFNQYDILLTSVHQCKGLEYDNVMVNDDFTEILVQSKKSFTASFVSASEIEMRTDMEFKMSPFSDELNLWYVAVTRCKKILSLPPKWESLMSLISGTLTSADDSNPENRGLKALFESFPLDKELMNEWCKKKQSSQDDMSDEKQRPKKKLKFKTQ